MKKLKKAIIAIVVVVIVLGILSISGIFDQTEDVQIVTCLLYTSPSPRDRG